MALICVDVNELIEEFDMKCSVKYECRSNGNSFQGSVEVERDFYPLMTDEEVLVLVRQDSVRFEQSGAVGIEVVSVEEIS